MYCKPTACPESTGFNINLHKNCTISLLNLLHTLAVDLYYLSCLVLQHLNQRTVIPTPCHPLTKDIRD